MTRTPYTRAALQAAAKGYGGAPTLSSNRPVHLRPDTDTRVDDTASRWDPFDKQWVKVPPRTGDIAPATPKRYRSKGLAIPQGR